MSEFPFAWLLAEGPTFDDLTRNFRNGGAGITMPFVVFGLSVLAAVSQNPSVAAASASTIGTNTPATRSASRCTGALPDCTSSGILGDAFSQTSSIERLAE